MSPFKHAFLAATLVAATSAAFAAPVSIVNLSAVPPTPNAGNNSGPFPYNPVTVTLSAGTYNIGEIGKAGGGQYDAYAVYADNGSNAAWTDSQWSFSLDNGATSAATRSSIGRFNTAEAALGAYAALPQLTLTLQESTRVSFYLNDTATPYFADDASGVSLGITQVGTDATGLPEPVSLSLVGVAVLAMGATRRRTKKAA